MQSCREFRNDIVAEVKQNINNMAGYIVEDTRKVTTHRLIEMKAKGVSRFGIGYKSAIQIMEQCEEA